MPRRRKLSPAETVADGLFEVLLTAPTWVEPVLAVAAFVVLGFIIPAVFPPPSKSYKAVIGTFSEAAAPMIGLLVLALWIFAEIRKRRHRGLLEKQDGLVTIRSLSWQEFEHLVGEAYRRQGYVVEKRGGDTPDGGIDLILRKNGEITVVQCKHWKAWKVGVKPVRELFGVMTAEQADRAVLATSGRFTKDALAFAEGQVINLLNGERLWSMIREIKQDTIAEAPPAKASGPAVCPMCASPMVERVARKGHHAGKKFLGCSKYPACRGKRDMR